MSPEKRQSSFVEELNKLCEKYGVTIRAVVQEEQLGLKKLVWASPTLELDPNWSEKEVPKLDKE